MVFVKITVGNKEKQKQYKCTGKMVQNPLLPAQNPKKGLKPIVVDEVKGKMKTKANTMVGY